ncbi:glyoxylate/hydroxypyruvate reductase HPR3-like [Bidens hawaiensis]|uniref:glyoxylate/hydroxypyruvate reductase HPR3-like n=1 Tax=Bidens hawaiensis TaxID=980011 RepID=UPI00404A51B2
MDPQELRQVLVLHPSPIFVVHEHPFFNKFNILKAYESPLPIHEFLHANAQSVKVVLCLGIAPFTADVIRDLPALELVVSAPTGVNHIDMDDCRRRGIIVTNARDVFLDDAADGTVGLLIDVVKRITGGDQVVRSGHWPSLMEYPLGSKVRNFFAKEIQRVFRMFMLKVSRKLLP